MTPGCIGKGLGTFTALALVALAGVASPVFAQAIPQASQTEGTDPGSILVTGERELEQKRVIEAVRGITMRGRSVSRALPRFQDPVCPIVTGLGDELGARVKARIEANTRSIGHEVGDEGCKPNAIVMLVDDPEGLIERMRKERGELLDADALRRIRTTLRAGYPAISWTGELNTDRYGNEAETSNTVAGLDEANGRILGELLYRRDNRAASRREIATSAERTSAFVVFDARRLDNVHLDQLADYATMRMLGDVKPTAQTGPGEPDTILNLFRMDALDAAPGLTLVDLAYLQGLYALEPRDPGTRLESFVLAAYDELRGSECPEADTPCAFVDR